MSCFEKVNIGDSCIKYLAVKLYKLEIKLKPTTKNFVVAGFMARD